jgi:hypothetical protein
VIKMYEKDILNSESNPQAFANARPTNDADRLREKVINIDIAAGDGSGILSTIAAGVASATQTLAVGTAIRSSAPVICRWATTMSQLQPRDQPHLGRA